MGALRDHLITHLTHHNSEGGVLSLSKQVK